jgi:hypothetical protein
MSLSAALVLAAATTASVEHHEASRGVVLAEARVTAEILPAAIVRQASGPERAGDNAPRHQLSRRGNRVLVEFQ